MRPVQHFYHGLDAVLSGHRLCHTSLPRTALRRRASAVLGLLRTRRALADRDPVWRARHIAVAAHVAGQDPVRLDADRLVAACDHHSAPIDSQRAVLGMNAEKLGRCPAQADDLGDKALNDAGTGLVDVGPGRRVDVVARWAQGVERAEGLRHSAALDGSGSDASSGRSIADAA